MDHRNESAAGSMLRGFLMRCPNCGEGRLFRRYLKPVDSCSACGTALGHIRADDFPPYLTIFVVGHLVVPLLVFGGRAEMSTGLQIAIAVPATLALIMLLLPRLKGAVIGLMWRLRLTGAESH
jgi:uncharacterized protein (DUF983 family)